MDLIIPAWCAANVNVRGGLSGSTEQSEWLGRSRFHGRGVSPIHPNKKRLVGGLCGETAGWWHRWRSRRRWITNMMHSEEIRSISRRASSGSITAITHPPLIGIFLIYVPATYGQSGGGGGEMICHLFISKQWSPVRAITYDSLYSRQLKETPGVVCPAVWGVWPPPGLACSRCVSRLPVLAMADLPALALGN